MEVKTFSEFGELPEHISPDEHKYIEAGRKFLIFYERILYKWQNTMTIEKDSDKYIMYFTNHKRWGFAEHESGTLSYPAIEGFLGIKFFCVFQKLFASKLFDWRNLLLEKSANLVADYAVHLFEAMDCTKDQHSEKWELLAKHYFWKQHKRRFEFEMVRDLVDLRRYLVKTPLCELFTYILPRDAILKTELKPKLTVTYYGETIQETDSVNNLMFFWPPPSNFKAREITDFNAYKALGYLPVPTRKFFIELCKVLDSYMQIGGSFQKNDTCKYQFCLVLSICDWEWLISVSQVPKVDNVSRLILKNTESSMLMKLFERISEILMLPDEMVAQVNKGISSITKPVVLIISQLLFELRYYKFKSGKPWELHQCQTVIKNFWKKEGKFQKKEKVLKCKDVSDLIVFKKERIPRNKDTGEPREKKPRSIRTQFPIIKEAPIIPSHKPNVSPKTKKLLRNGRTVVKRRRGTFSFPCRGYVPPAPKVLYSEEVSIQQAEKTNRILQRKLFSDKNPEFAQMVKIFECNKHCYEISVTIEDLLPGKTVVSQNVRSFFGYVLATSRLSLEILKRRHDIENVLYFSLIPNTDSLNMDHNRCLLETNWVLEKQSCLSPSEIVEKVFDRMLTIFTEKGILQSILYNAIHRDTPLNLIPLIAQPVLVHLRKLLEDGFNKD